MIDCSCDLPVTNCIIAFHLPDSSSKPSWSQTANKKRSNIIVSLHLFKWQAHMDVSENSGISPQIIHFNRAFHYKPSILGYHYFWKHPCIFTYTFELFFFSGKSIGKRGISMDRMGSGIPPPCSPLFATWFPFQPLCHPVRPTRWGDPLLRNVKMWRGKNKMSISSIFVW